MNKLKEHRLLILCCVLFFLSGILVCQVNFDKWMPNTSSDLAAWLQAVGAIIAMGVAIYLSKIPIYQEKRNVVISLRMLHKALIESTQQIEFGAREGHPIMIVLARVCLEQHMQSLSSVKYELLSSDGNNAFYRIKVSYAQLAHLARLYEDDFDNKELAKGISLAAGEVLRIMKREVTVVWGKLNGVDPVRFDFDEFLKSAENRTHEDIRRGEELRKSK